MRKLGQRQAFLAHLLRVLGFHNGSEVKNPPAMQETQKMRVQSLGQEDPLGEGMTTHPVCLPGESHGTEEPGGLQSMGSHRVGFD